MTLTFEQGRLDQVTKRLKSATGTMDIGRRFPQLETLTGLSETVERYAASVVESCHILTETVQYAAEVSRLTIDEFTTQDQTLATAAQP